jgi:hypothetical protein
MLMTSCLGDLGVPVIGRPVWAARKQFAAELAFGTSNEELDYHGTAPAWVSEIVQASYYSQSFRRRATPFPQFIKDCDQ